MRGTPILRRLTEAVASLFDEDERVAEVIARILLTGKARVFHDDMVSLANNLVGVKGAELLAREAAMAMMRWRLMLPVRSVHGRGLAWEHRLGVPRAGEAYEVPRCIAYAFEGLASRSTWDWRSGVKEYMRRIGESHGDIVLRVIEGVVARSYSKHLTNASTIREACRRYGYPKSVGSLIAELKGGGIISPCLGLSFILSRLAMDDRVRGLCRGAPIYELNKALFVLEAPAGYRYR